LALLAIAIAVVLVRGDNPRDIVARAARGVQGSATPPPPPAVAARSAPAIDEFIRYVELSAAPGRIPPADRYAAEGTQRLAVALDYLAVRVPGADADVRGPRTQLRQRTAELQDGVQSPQDVAAAREAFIAAVMALTVIQQRQAAELARRLDEARRAADAVRPDRPLRDQPAEIQQFFRSASVVLEKVAGTAP